MNKRVFYYEYCFLGKKRGIGVRLYEIDKGWVLTQVLLKRKAKHVTKLIQESAKRQHSTIIIKNYSYKAEEFKDKLIKNKNHIILRESPYEDNIITMNGFEREVYK